MRFWTKWSRARGGERPRKYRPAVEPLEIRLTPSGAPLVEPPVIHSVNGVLKATLTEEVGPAQVGDTSVVDAWTYNGDYVGPTLMANPGDLLDITIVNNLPEPTNLHTHGLHVSPLGNSDDVLLDIEPGESNHYQIQLPADHPQGLYWYHPHMHGDVNDQISRGLSGLLVIGRPDGGAPQLDGLPQHLLALQNALLQGNHIVNPQQVQGDNFDPSQQTFTVNGQLQPVMTVQAGVPQVINIANVGNNAFYGISLLDNTGKVRPVSLVALDGNPFTQAQPQALGPPSMPPGRRWSWVFTPPANAVNGWKLVSTGFNDGSHNWPGTPSAPLVLMTINFSGSTQQPPPPLGPLSPPENYFQDLSNAPVAVKRQVVFGEIQNPDGTMTETINGAPFPNNPVFQPRLNTVEEWTLINPTDDDHPFHLHVDAQQVTVANGGAGGGNSLGGLARFQDVINVPAGKTVVIRIAFKDFLGTFVYHCHRVDHEDDGMMSLVQVLPQQSILVTGASAGAGPQVNVYDGDSKALLRTFNAFASGFTGGVNVAVGDVNNDGVSDVLCAAGPGGGPEVKVFSGKDFSLLYDFFAFAPSFTGGVAVAAGDINGDGFDDIICGAGPGGGPNVHVFSGKDGSSLLNFFAFEPGFTGGVSLAAGDLDGDGRIEMIAGAGAGGGPNVRVFDDQGGVMATFFAFNPNFTGGVNVGVGRVRGIGFDSLITGAGAGGGPSVTAYQANSIHDAGGGMDHSSAGGGHAMSFTQIASFFAYAPTFTGGVRVGSLNKTLGTNYLTGPGPGGGPQVSLFDGVTQATVDTFFSGNPTFAGGISVAAN